MTIARLDNEVFFKKAFTDEIVFKAFVKDIIGIEIEPDKINEKTREIYKDEVLISSLNPKNPNVNTQNAGVKRAAEIVSFENISPEEWEEAKIEASKRKVIKLEREEERFDIARKLLNRNLSDDAIAEDTGLTVEQVMALREEE